MADAVPHAAVTPERYTVERYFGLVDEGVLAPDDPVELLAGVIVAMSPQNAPHAAAICRTAEALRAAIGAGAAVREEKPLVLGTDSVPEPDVAVVPGRTAHYDTAHPTTALLVVEVADSSLPQDRLTKAAIYAAAGIPEYWIVNLRATCVEVFRAPDAKTRRYGEQRVVRPGQHLELVALPGASVAVGALLPGREA